MRGFWILPFLILRWCSVYAIQVEDGSGRLVQLESPAERIVTLSPHTTELVFAVGAGERIIGTVAWSDYPPQARSIPRIGDASRLDRERLLTLRPDLVIAWAGGNPPADLAWLERQGIAVYHSDPRRLTQIADDMEALGLLLGHQHEAGQAAGKFRQRLARLRQRYRDAPTFRYFYQLWPQPLMTVGNTSLISQALTLCQGKNVFAQLAVLSTTVDREAAVAANPDTLIAPQEQDQEGDPFAAWRRWKYVEAVKRQRLITVPADLMHRPTPRLLDGIEHLCRQAHQ